MAAKLNLRRGSSFTNPSISEPFFNTNSETLEVGYGTTTGEHITLVKIGENTGNISIVGDVTASNMLLTGNTTVDGNIYLGGDIFLGDGTQATDNINVNATFSGSIVPVTADVFDLGADGKYWNTIFALTGSFSNGIISGSSQLTTEFDLRYLEIGGDNVFSSSLQTDLTQTTNYVTGIKTRLDTETVISGSSQVQIDLVTDFTPFSSSVDGRLDSLENTDITLDGRLDNLELFSSSQETKDLTLEVVTSSFDGRLDNIESFTSSYFTDSASVDSRLDTIEGPLSTSLDNRLDLLESFSSSLDDTFVTTTELNLATSSLSASLTQTDVDFEGRIYTLETTFSSSVDSRLDVIEGSFSQSVDSRLDDTESTGSEHESRLDNIESYTASLDNVYEEKASSTHTLVSGSSQVQIDSVTGFTAHSSSVDGRLIDIETTFSSSVDSRLDLLSDVSHSHSNKTQLDIINQDLSNISNVTFNSITASANVLVTGNLTVLGSATEIQTTNLVISDKLITIASGSSNSAEADGSGIEIDGAGKSIIWDDATQSFILNAKVSSSVGFKGDGSELTGVTASDVEYLNVLNKPTLVSGSSQISYTGITDKPTLVSGSSQIDHDSTTNFVANEHIDHSSVSISAGSGISGGGDITTTRTLTLDTGSVHFKVGVKEKMNEDTVVSGSSQILGGSGIFSSSNETFTEFSSSIDNRVVTLETTFSSSVDSRLDAQEAFSESLDSEFLNTNGDNVITGSDQVTASLDLKYEEISSGTNTLVSGSSQIDVTQTQNYGSIRQYDNTDNTTHLNSLNVVSGSTYSSPTQGTLRASINGVNSDVNLGLQSTDTPTFNSLTASNLPNHDNTHFDAVFKGTSGEFGYRTLATAAFYHVSNSIDDGNPLVLGNAGAVKSYVDDKIIAASSGDITEVNAGNGLGGGSTIGVATLTLDTGSQHFIDGVTAIAPTLPSGLVSGSDQVTSSLDSRYVNVSGDTVSGNLVISGDLTVNGTTTTINTTNLNVEDNIIELNFGGSATNGGLLVKDSTGGSTTSGSLLWDGTNDYWIAGISGSENRILTTADNVITDSNINTNVVEILNNENVHSGSYLGTATTSNLTEGSGLYYTNVRVKTKLDADGVISGSSQVQINSVTGFTTFSGSVDTRIDSLESFSSSLDAGFVTETELNTVTQSLVDSIGTKLNTGSYNTDSQSFDSRIDSLEGATSENPLTFNDTTTIDLVRSGDTITANVIGGVVSGSSQVIGILDSLNSYTSSNDTNQTTQDGRLNNLESYTASVDSLYEEIASETHTLVSGSSQVDVTQTTNYNVISSHISSSTNPHSVTANQVGLGNVTNESKATMFTSPTFTGTVIAPTPSNGDDSTKVATTAFVMQEVSDLIGGAGAAFDTLLEISASIANGDSDVVALTTLVGGKLQKDQNLSDLTDVSIARNNLNLGITASVEFSGGVSTDLLTITSGSVTRGTIYGDEDGIYLTAPAGKGIGILTDGATDGMIIQSDGSTTIYGSLALENIPSNPSATIAVMVGAGNTMNYRTLGSNAFTSASYLTSETDTLSSVTGRGATTATAISITDTTASTTKTSGALVVTGGIGTSGDINAGGDVVAYASSDRRLKDNILPIENPLQKINSIGGYSFDWNVEKQHIYSGKDYGVIAQEIEEILPELVQTRENGYKAVKYDKLVSLLIEGIKELSNEVNELKQQINK
jgi:hypothetical protein